MHELGLMQTALDMAFAQARRAGASRIHTLRLRVGIQSGVVVEALEMAFTVATSGTPADSAELVIESVPVICRCRRCGRDFQADDVIYCCPICGELSAHVSQGTELELASLEVS